MSRVVQESETLHAQAPTTLRLFERPGLGARLVQDIQFFDQAKNMYFRSIRALEQYVSVTKTHHRSVVETKSQAEDEQRTVRSSATFGQAYLLMMDEFASMGVPEVDSFDFFKRAVVVNASLYNQLLQEANRLGSVGKIGSTKQNEMLGRLMVKYFEVDTPPSWFKGTEQEWLKFVTEHVGIPEYVRRQSKKIYGEEKEAYAIRYDGLPDWLSFDVNTPPNRETVEEELKEDSLEQNRISARIDRLDAQVDHITSSFGTKVARTRRWLLRQPAEIASRIVDIATHVLFLDYYTAAYGQVSDSKALAKIVAEQGKEVAAFRKDPINEYTKAHFSHPLFYFSPESLALWMEKNLIDSGVATSTQQVIDSTHIEHLRRLLEMGESTNGLPEEWHNLDKKVVKFLYYGIKPLFERLTDAEREYLLEYAQELTGEPLEAFIWEAVDAIFRSGVRRTFVYNPKRFESALEDIKTYIIKWITNNWRWAYSQVRITARGGSESITVSQQEGEDTKLENGNVVSADIQELEQETEQLEQGHLGDWQIFYTLNSSSVEDKYLVEIGGKTLQERAGMLQQFLREYGVVCTVKPDVIIAELDDIAKPEDTTEHIRPHLGEFKKRWKSGMRILYQANHDRKVMVFHLYKKEAQSYRKL